MIGNLFTAGTSLLSGFLARDAQKDANDRAAAEKEKDRQLSLEFAKNGIRWKADDARAAGLHPLAALGGGSSYSGSAIAFAPESGLATGLAAAGQDVGRAINATRTAPERDAAFTKTIQDLTVTKLGLENQKLAADVAASKIGVLKSAQVGPPMPVPEADKAEDRPKLFAGRGPVATDAAVSNADDFQKRYGEMSDWTFGPYIAWRDLRKNYPEYFIPEDSTLRDHYRGRHSFKARWSPLNSERR